MKKNQYTVSPEKWRQQMLHAYRISLLDNFDEVKLNEVNFIDEN